MQGEQNQQLLQELLTWFQLTFGETAWQQLKAQLTSDQPDQAIAQLREYYLQNQAFFDQKIDIARLELLDPDHDK
jgi:hypothetical protein